MSDHDLIRRGDALRIVDEDATAAFAYGQIRALPAVSPGVKPLVWENFDAWTYWARSTVGTYHVKERNGVWRATLETRAGDELVYEYTTDGLTPGDFEAALLATQADHEARILSALDMQPPVSPDVAALVDDAGLLLDAYKAVLVLHRVMDKHGLTAGASAAENIADRIVAAHPEFPGLCALRGNALAEIKDESHD